MSCRTTATADLRLELAAAEGDATRLPAAHCLTGAVEVHIAVPVIGTLDAATLQLSRCEGKV